MYLHHHKIDDDEFYFAGYDSVNKEIVLAYRGTENMDNWITNGNIARDAYKGVNCSDCYVHGGFQDLYWDARD